MILGTQTHLSTLTDYNRNHHKPYHTHSMSFFAFSFIYAIAYMPFFFVCTHALLTYITEKIFMQSIYILVYTHILLWWPAKFELKGIINNILIQNNLFGVFCDGKCAIIDSFWIIQLGIVMVWADCSRLDDYWYGLGMLMLEFWCFWRV